jgi:hypothetical protein
MKSFHILIASPILAVLVACGGDDSTSRDDKGQPMGSGGDGSTASSSGTKSSGSGGSTMETAGSGGSTTGTGGESSTTQLCFSTVVTVNDLTLMQGDADFGAHGPIVDVSVTLSRTDSTVTANTCVTMTETVSDWTTATRCVPTTVNAPNTGLVTAEQNTIAYTDTDHSVDDAEAEASLTSYDPLLIESVKCEGDTFGNDACSGPDCAYCEVTLGCVELHAP